MLCFPPDKLVTLVGPNKMDFMIEMIEPEKIFTFVIYKKEFDIKYFLCSILFTFL